MKPAKPRSIQIVEGQWYSLGHYDKTECCDCGLVHQEEFKLEDGRIWFRTFRDEPATRRARKRRELETRQPRRQKGTDDG